jgi:hypothetical protein
MTYKIKITLADIIGPDVNLFWGENEDAVNIFVHNILRRSVMIDIDQLLLDRQAIALIWEVTHVQDQRPDLSEEQAWEVLQECDRSWDRLNDPMLARISQVAENLFPNPPGKAALQATLRRLERQIEALPEDERTDPAAYGCIGAELDHLATLAKGE